MIAEKIIYVHRQDLIDKNEFCKDKTRGVIHVSKHQPLSGNTKQLQNMYVCIGNTYEIWHFINYDEIQ